MGAFTPNLENESGTKMKYAKQVFYKLLFFQGKRVLSRAKYLQEIGLRPAAYQTLSGFFIESKDCYNPRKIDGGFRIVKISTNP